MTEYKDKKLTIKCFLSVYSSLFNNFACKIKNRYSKH